MSDTNFAAWLGLLKHIFQRETVASEVNVAQLAQINCITRRTSGVSCQSAAKVECVAKVE